MLDAAFSFGTSPDGYQSAFATIEDGSITEMYIAEDFKKGTGTIYYTRKNILFFLFLMMLVNVSRRVWPP